MWLAMSHSNEPARTTIGERIAWALEQSGKRENQLAAEIDVHQTTIARWLSGRRVPETLQVAPLADALGVNVRWLLTGKGSPTERDVRGGGGPSRRDGEPTTTPRPDGLPDRRQAEHGRRSTDAE
jgi:transcriptional regulator with XRE-family HTH domain